METTLGGQATSDPGESLKFQGLELLRKRQREAGVQWEVRLGAPTGPQVETWDITFGVLETHGRKSLRGSTPTEMQGMVPGH